MKTDKYTKRDCPFWASLTAMPSKKLSRWEASKSSFEDRLASIGKYIASEAAKFYFSLSREGRVSFDLDDICTEVWICLKEKNGKYNPEEGGYLNFAGKLIKNKLIELREHSRCVRMPEGTSGTFALFDKANELGVTTPRMTEMMSRILSAGRDHMPLVVNPRQDSQELEPIDESDEPHEELEREEREIIQVNVLAERLSTLTTLENVALGASIGLWGQEKTPIAAVASRYGLTPQEMCSELRSARRKLGITAKL